MNVECLRESIHVQTNMGWINTSTMGNEMSHSYFSSSHTWGCIYDIYLSDFTGIDESLPQIFHFPLSKTNKQKIFPCVGLVRATQLLWTHGQWRPYFKPGLPNSGFYNCKLTCTMGGIRESVLPSASILLSRLYCKSPGFSSQEGEVKWTRHGLEANW